MERRLSCCGRVTGVSRINPEELLLAYRLGIFPMAESRNAEDVLWIRPHERGIIPLDTFHVPRRLARVVRSDRFRVTANNAFFDVIRGCAESRPDRRDTWINNAIIEVFEALYRRGLAHSIEVWRGDRLVGGLYGLAIGGAFFAESKFSREKDASKVALVHLAARLKAGGFILLDAQFPNPHLDQFGAVVVTEERFQQLLTQALAANADFYFLAPVVGPGAAAPEFAGAGTPLPSAESGAAGLTGSSVLQVITQTS
jgi:leucyl/phenylalanyl-tRNA---protein transferase